MLQITVFVLNKVDSVLQDFDKDAEQDNDTVESESDGGSGEVFVVRTNYAFYMTN